ncbi:cytochrome P450 [Telmatobacter sp. DSM 110680]|uniref:Cytochrome P450 n=1 Tax=Telmatobacter sp. DSM 110680 TaxID=3036704 RepID=A0AAU7DPG0_9BACT
MKSNDSDLTSSDARKPAKVVIRGQYAYPPGLRFNLPFYRFHRFFDPTNPILLFEHLQRYGRAAHYRILMHDVVLFNDPNDIGEVLIDKAVFFGKDRTQKRMKILLGEGMITSDGEKHNRGRRIAAPAFHRRRIERYAQQIVEIAAGFRSQWKPGEELNISAEMMRLSLQITARTLFDTEVTPEIHEINDQVNIVMDLYNFLVALPRAELLLGSPLPQMRRFRAAKKRLDEVVSGMISARSAEAATPGADNGADLLSMLLAARDDQGDGLKLNAQELRDQVLTLFLAGYETVANALGWTWLLLGQNPEAANRFHAELDAVLGDRLATLEDVPRLSYTTMVLSESMRLYPPAWAMGREVLADVSIGPYRLRKGTMVFFSQYIVQRDPKWFPEPELFRPERFTAEAKAGRPRFAYFPFGGGGRQCIGESFAWMEAILALATIAQRWRVELVAGQRIELQPKITLRPKNGIRVSILPRG